MKVKAKAKISKLPTHAKAGSLWLVRLPGDNFQLGYTNFERARQRVADWVDGKIR